MYILSYFNLFIYVFYSFIYCIFGDRRGWGVSCLLTFIDTFYSIKISVGEVACWKDLYICASYFQANMI